MCIYMHVYVYAHAHVHAHVHVHAHAHARERGPRAQEAGFLVAENEPGMMHNELQQHRAKAVGSEKLIERARQMCRSS